jgi:hypothetical protein
MYSGLITFRDGNTDFHVAKRQLAWPPWFSDVLQGAKSYLFQPPVFSPGEAAAGFIRASKSGPGDISLLPGEHWEDIAPKETAFHYVVTGDGGALHVEATLVFWDGVAEKWHCRHLFSGTPEAFKEWSNQEKAKS